MSQSKHGAYESEETVHQHGENAQFEAKLGLSWRDLEMDAKLNTVGTAVSEGAKKFEAFMKTVLKLATVIAGTVVAILIALVAKSIIETN